MINKKLILAAISTLLSVLSTVVYAQYVYCPSVVTVTCTINTCYVPHIPEGWLSKYIGGDVGPNPGTAAFSVSQIKDYHTEYAISATNQASCEYDLDGEGGLIKLTHINLKSDLSNSNWQQTPFGYDQCLSHDVLACPFID